MVALGALVWCCSRQPINGATRWLGIGGLGIQPSELAKLAIIIFTAAVLERRMHRIDEVSHSLLPIGVVLGGIVALILLQPDLGTAVFDRDDRLRDGVRRRAQLQLSRRDLPRVGSGALLAARRPSTAGSRVEAFLDPWGDPLGKGHQMIQSMIAVGTGGILGRGLMGGMQKLFYLPEPHNDFIYSVIAEELGFIGASVVVGCFCVITWRGLRAAVRAPDRFGAFMAIGLTTMMAFQALFNISVVLGLLPTKGIPLPFVSAGGSSLLINMVGMGILLNISQHASPAHVVTTRLARPDA